MTSARSPLTSHFSPLTSHSPLPPSRVRLSLQVQPRASRTEVAGLHGSRIRIRLAAPPVDGAANEELIRFLAETLGVQRDAVRIVAGHSSRQKTVEVAGLTGEEAARRLRVEEA